MGINGLNNFLKENVPEINKKINLSSLKKQKIAIDTSIYLYKYKYNNNFIEGFLKQLYRLKLNNIIPIYIFDGKPPIEKCNIIKNRKKKKIVILKNIKKLEEELNLCSSLFEKIKINEKIEMQKKKIINITDNDIVILKTLLDKLGIPYLQSKTEADFLCNTLFKNKIIDMVLSEDNDILVGGTKKLLKNFNYYSNKIIMYDLDIILKKLQINNEQWIHLCILMGCDYCLKIHNLDSNNCLKLIKTYNINNIFINKLKLNKDYVNDFNKAKNLFLNNTKINTNINFKETKIVDRKDIINFLYDYTNMNKKEINFILEVIYK